MLRKFVDFMKKFLHFFKLLNHNDELSLTNIAFWIFLYKISLADMSQMTVGELATALSVVGLYFGTKVLNRGVEEKVKNAAQVVSTVSTIAKTVADKVVDPAESTASDEEQNGGC